MDQTLFTALTLVFGVLVIIAVPCVFISVLGYKMLNKLAYYPSKNPAIQMSILGWLIVVEVVSVTLLLIFYQVLTKRDTEGARHYERNADISISYSYGGSDRCHYFLSA